MPQSSVSPDQVAATMKSVRSFARAFEPPETIPSHDGIVLQLYWRHLGLFDSVDSLLPKRLPEEALIIARSLFVESLWLAEAAEAGPGRAVLLLRLAKDQIRDARNLMRQAKRCDLDDKADESISLLDEQLRKLEQYAATLGIGKDRKFRETADSAMRLGLKDDYWSFLFGHKAVHAPLTAMGFRSTSTDSNELHLSNRTSNTEVIGEVARFTSRSLLRTTVATGEIFGWTRPTTYDELVREVQRLGPQVMSNREDG